MSDDLKTQKIKVSMLIAPLISSLIVSLWVGSQTGMPGTVMLVFAMWSVAGIFTLVLFGFPLIILIRKFTVINLFMSVLISLVSTELMTLLFSILLPSREPWYVGFLNLSKVNVPGSIVAGVSLWYFGFREELNDR